MQSKVISAAELAARKEPYCLEVDDKPVNSRRKLTAASMPAEKTGGYTWNFHALLVIGQGETRRYMNWSYRRARFDHVREESHPRQRLDQQVTCVVAPHFARDRI